MRTRNTRTGAPAHVSTTNAPPVRPSDCGAGHAASDAIPPTTGHTAPVFLASRCMTQNTADLRPPTTVPDPGLPPAVQTKLLLAVDAGSTVAL